MVTEDSLKKKKKITADEVSGRGRRSPRAPPCLRLARALRREHGKSTCGCHLRYDPQQPGSAGRKATSPPFGRPRTPPTDCD